jgi:hypothetical protein
MTRKAMVFMALVLAVATAATAATAFAGETKKHYPIERQIVDQIDQVSQTMLQARVQGIVKNYRPNNFRPISPRG